MKQPIAPLGQGKSNSQYRADCICGLIGLAGSVGTILCIILFNLLT